MHELGVTFHIMDHLEKVAAENEVTKITKVTLELGEVSTVIESYLTNCWKWAAKKRPLFIRRYSTEKSVRAAAVGTRIWCRVMSSTLRK